MPAIQALSTTPVNRTVRLHDEAYPDEAYSLATIAIPGLIDNDFDVTFHQIYRKRPK
jgi:hypothetical protein